MSVAAVLYKTRVHAGKGKAATPTRTRSLAPVPLSAVAQHSDDVHWPLPTTGRPEVGNNKHSALLDWKQKMRRELIQKMGRWADGSNANQEERGRGRGRWLRTHFGAYVWAVGPNQFSPTDKGSVLGRIGLRRGIHGLRAASLSPISIPCHHEHGAGTPRT